MINWISNSLSCVQWMLKLWYTSALWNKDKRSLVAEIRRGFCKVADTLLRGTILWYAARKLNRRKNLDLKASWDGVLSLCCTSLILMTQETVYVTNFSGRVGIIYHLEFQSSRGFKYCRRKAPPVWDPGIVLSFHSPIIWAHFWNFGTKTDTVYSTSHLNS